MARRAFRPGAAAIHAKRLTTWFELKPVETTITEATAALVATFTTAELALRPFTIVRTHLELWLRSDQAAAIERQHCGIGLAVVSDQAIAVGVTAVPTPVTEAASNLWFLHQFMSAAESNLTDRTRNGTFRTVDSKAMRKVEVGQDLAVVVEGGVIGSGMVVGMALRMLIKNN